MWAKVGRLIFVIAILNLSHSLRLTRSIIEDNSNENTNRSNKITSDGIIISTTLGTTTVNVNKWNALSEELSKGDSEESDESIKEKVIMAPTHSTTTTTSTTTSTTITPKPPPSASPITWSPEERTPYPTPQPHKHKNANNDTKENIASCERYKEGAVKFELDRMVDVWQTAYYKLPEKVQCFKMRIQKVSEDEKIQYEKKYGNFNGVVDWNECNLEIIAEAQYDRKHFLQGIKADWGVMDNIIIIEGSDTGTPVIKEDTADQWLVANNMLLMRDCDIGGVVVFSKVPTFPKPNVIKDVLRDFSEEYVNGKMACGDEEDTRSFDEEEID